MIRFKRLGVVATLLVALSALLIGATASTVSAASDCTVFGTSGNDTFIVGPGQLPTDAIICGGKGDDTLDDVPFSFVTFSGTFYGGQGNDWMSDLTGGTFQGGGGDDGVEFFASGLFDGGRDNDTVEFQIGGTYRGGPGYDVLVLNCAGTQLSVENLGDSYHCPY